MVQHNYEDMARELKLADDRANKAANDAQHFEGLLREESAKVQKIDSFRIPKRSFQVLKRLCLASKRLHRLLKLLFWDSK